MVDPKVKGFEQRTTILYSRLSRDDDLQGESGSITNQRRLLEEYAEKHGFTPYESVCDDGYSGTGWGRPGWQRLLDKVDSGSVSTIILKDLSRMGRDYLRVGLFLEMFRERGVRLIAVNDGLDTDNGEDDFTPFRTIIAEMYARDTSRKIKSVFHKKGRDGKPMCTNPIYGFRKDPNDKDIWIEDEEAAAVVQRIFRMTIDGMGPFIIARKLSEEKIERPSYYLYRAGIHATPGKCNLDLPYNWRGNTISKMLQQREYMGDRVNFKYSKPSFKNPKVIRNAAEDQMIFEGVLPAIISREHWELAQKLRKTRRVSKQGLPPNPLTGLLFCADCEGKMTNRRRTMAPDGFETIPSLDTYECSTYRNSMKRQIDKCSIHYVTTAAVRKHILDTIRNVCGFVRENKNEFIKKVREASIVRAEETARTHRKQVEKNERRIAELDALFQRVYEDNANGRLTDERFEQLSAAYEGEQAILKEKNAELVKGLGAFNADSIRIDRFIELVRRYEKFDDLTTPMLNEFIDKVLIHQADKSSGKRVQQMDVYFSFIGLVNIDLPAAELS